MSLEGFSRQERASPPKEVSRRTVLKGLLGAGATALGARGTEAGERVDLAHSYEQTGVVEQITDLYAYLQTQESARILPREGSSESVRVEPERLREMRELALQSIRRLYEAEGSEAPEAERLRSALETFLRLTPVKAVVAATEEVANISGEDPHTPRSAYSPFLELAANHWSELWPREQWQAAAAASDEVGASMYHRDAPTVHDPILNARLTCRSGTYLFLQAAAYVLSPETQQKLVIIYTNGHMLPGYQREDGDFVGLEMTADVERWPTFDAKNSEGHQGYRVVKAHGAVIENISGKKLRQDTVLLEVGDLEPSSPFMLASEEHATARASVANTSGAETVAELHAFGEAVVPEGDTPRAQIQSIVYGRSPEILAPADASATLGREGN